MKQIEHTANGARFLLCEMPKESHKHRIIPTLSARTNSYLYWDENWGHDCTCEKPLLPGNWQIVGIAAELSEGDAAQVTTFLMIGTEKCDQWWAEYYKYQANRKLLVHTLASARDSLQSLCDLHNLSPDRTLILKAVK